ncbi:MAG: CoA-binding protein [Chitinophagaceae bacterium]|nr:MAG: CoA-binding protein [Chitinophagaceae bacterium]
MEEKKTTLVLGASENPSRYSYLAIERLLNAGIEVVAVGAKKGNVHQHEINDKIPFDREIHTISMYLSAKNQQAYFDDILKLKPKRIIFNPGAENRLLEKTATENQIEVLHACTLVMLSTDTF